MSELVRRALAPFPEPVVIFDVDDRMVIFANPAVLFLTEGNSPDLTLDELGGMKLDDFMQHTGLGWEDSTIGRYVEGQHTGSLAQYREDLRAWVIASTLDVAFNQMHLAVASVHARGDEGVAHLQHARVRGITELALYIADARQDNVMAMHLVQANYKRMQTLEGALTRMVTELGSSLLS